MPTKDGKTKPIKPIGFKEGKIDTQMRKTIKKKDIAHREMNVGLDEKLNKVKANEKEKTSNKNLRKKVIKEKY